MNINSNKNLLDYINSIIFTLNIEFMWSKPSDCNSSDIWIPELGDDKTISTLEEFGKVIFRQYKKATKRVGYTPKDGQFNNALFALFHLKRRAKSLVSRPFSLEGLKAISAKEALNWSTDAEYIQDTILL